MTKNDISRTHRRGVTLLLVLALMAMFAMLIVTFMIVTTQARRMSETTAETILKDDPAASNYVYDAFDVLLVGGLDTVIGPHGILENLYGHPVSGGFTGIEGTFQSDNLSTTANNTALYYAPKDNNNEDQGYFDYGPFGNASGLFYNIDMIGKVVTVTELPSNPTDRQKELLGKSTFIIDMDENRVVLAPFQVLFDVADQRAQLIRGTGCKFIVNSPAFSGTGPGFDVTANANTAALTGHDGDNNPILYTLRPNAMAPNLSNGAQAYHNYLRTDLVMMNPDYTAPDLLNMFLAWYDVDDGATPQINDIIPSFHRPDLIRYHLNNTTSTNINLMSSDLRRRNNDLRKVVLRPTPFDHPDFTGSNPVAGPVLGMFVPGYAGSNPGKSFITDGPWDVDNDNDGIADSIWLDVGLSSWTDISTGKMYKPLAAFLVLDMDGRVNVNTHGNVLHALDSTFDSDIPDAVEDNGGVKVRGSGSGPAEVRLDKTRFGSKLKDLLLGKANSSVGDMSGRYGDSDLIGSISNATAANLAAIPAPGTALQDYDTDLWNDADPFIWDMGVRSNAYNYVESDDFTGFGGLYPDWWGQAALAFDPLGNRFPVGVDSFPPMHLYRHNPYLMNPYGDTPGTADESFGADVLQYILRMPGDSDYTNLPVRLRELLDGHVPNAVNWSDQRFTVTTRSSDIPSPGFYAASKSSGVRTLFSLILRTMNGNSTRAERLLELLPEEIRRGERIDLNRLSHSTNWAPTHDVPNLTATKRREMLKEKAKFAQGIYLLLMILCRDQLTDNSGAPVTSVEGMDYKDAVTRLAQWSVNLVDFMDPDAVMTPLIFHTQPFMNPIDYASQYTDAIFNNNSSVSGVLDNDVRLVWGMEQPEVALTKTFATHNLRIADTKHNTQEGESIFHEKSEYGDNNTHSVTCGKHLHRIAKGCEGCTCGAVHDTDFDQILIPQGSLFLEIYRKGDPKRTRYMSDMYYNNDNDKIKNRLNLGKTIDGTGDFVWRLAIGEAARGNMDETPNNNSVFKALEIEKTRLTYSFQPKRQWPTSADDPLSGDCTIVPERFIFFGPEPNNPSVNYKGKAYYNYGAPSDLSPNNNPKFNVMLEPNDYLVIGPRQFTSFQSKPVKEAEKGEDPGDTEHFGTPKKDPGTYIDLAELEDTANVPPGAKAPKVMVAAAPLPTFWATNDTAVGYVLPRAIKGGIGVSVSEPLPLDPQNSSDPYDEDSYYPIPNFEASDGLVLAMTGDTTAIIKDGYHETANANSPLDKDKGFYGFGTIPCYKAVFLQRLADPNRPWNEVTNPYITVDWNMIDLHVFNSERDENSDIKYDNNLFDDEDVGDSKLKFNKEKGLYFAMRQWGYTAKLDDPTDAFPNIWDRSFDSKKTDAADGGLLGGADESGDVDGSDEAKFDVSTTVFGRLVNYEGISTLQAGGSLPDGTSIQAYDSQNPDASNGTHNYVGAPNKAWQHYAWNNAPLTNTLELMQVPASSAGRFGFESRDNKTIPGASLSAGWSLGTKGRFGCMIENSTTENGKTPEIGPYLNFFSSNQSLNLATFLEFVRVPSRFVGTIRGWTNDDKPIYAMREPGKINLNTATAEAWEALSGSLSGNDWATYQKLMDVREGGGTYPSRFAFPFRSPNAGNLVPISGMRRNGPHDATILRDGSGMAWSNSGTFFRVDDEASNQYTLLENVQRLSDMTTNRSNVFAVWVTIGYFEVDKYEANADGILKFWSDYPNNIAPGVNHTVADNFPSTTAGDIENIAFFEAVYPGGYVFKKEKGLADGTVKRNRAFFLIDRSIPVGFRRGNKIEDKDKRPSVRNVIVLEKPLD